MKRFLFFGLGAAGHFRNKLIALFVLGLLMVGVVFLFGVRLQKDDNKKTVGAGDASAPQSQAYLPVAATSHSNTASPLAQSGLLPKDPNTPRQRNSTGQALPFRTRALSADFSEKILNTTVGSSIKLELFPDVKIEATLLRRWQKGGSLRFAMALVGYPEKDYFFYSISAGAGQGLVEIPSRNLAYEIRQAAGQSPEVREWLFTDRVCASPPPDGASAERGSPRPSVFTDPERGRAPRGIDPADVPALESRPGTPRVFYLDFDGETVSGTAWVNGGQILAPAAQMTPNQVRLVWERVCRDFDPFDVNITTLRSVYDAAPETSRIMCVVTANDAAAPGAGGVAYLESFEMDEASGKKICWAFIDDDAKNTAEVISHEIGHTLSLTHDGREAFRGQAREEYYAGHGNGQTGWAPIMGVGYYQNLVQWSKGEYYRANNPEDDLAAIGERLPYLPMVHGGTFPDATVVTNALSTGVIGDGLLLRATNSEILAISNLPAGLHTVEVVPSRNGNVDARLEILLPNGNTNRNLNPPDFLGVKSFFNQAATTNLFFRISAAGRGEPANEFGKTGYKDGYSSYGSLGQYRLLYRRMVEFSDEYSLTNPVGVRISKPLYTSYLVQGEEQLISTNASVQISRATNLGFGGVTNITITETHFLTNVYSNNLITLHPNFIRTNGLVLVPLAAPNTNPLGLASLTGLLEGSASTNFILALSNNLTVAASNRTVVRTNRLVVEHVTVISNNGDSTNTFRRQPSTNSFATSVFTSAPVLLTTFTNTNNLRLVFQRPALVTFTNTTMGAYGTNWLPVTNSLGLAYGYRVLSAPGTGRLTNIGGINGLVSTSPLPALLEVSLRPTSPALEIWSSNALSFSIFKTNPAATAFAFVTNPTAVPATATNLRFGQSTPLVVTNSRSSRVVFTIDSGGRVFFSNHPLIPNLQIPFFQATTGTGTSTVTATLAATATSAATTSTVNITLTQAPAPAITMLGVFSNLAWTNSNAAVTTAALVATNPGRYTIGFTSTNTNLVRIDNNRTLVMLANGTSQIVASILFLDTNNFLQSQPVTNTLVVEWPSNPPVFTSTNRQDGVQGVPFTYFMVAGPNTNAFPITYGASNLAPGLFFVTPNRILGTPPQAGLFRMALTASNAAGTTNGQLLSYFTNFPPLRVTNAWSFVLSLGVGSDTNGTYLFSTNGSNGAFASGNLPSGIGSVTNSNSATPPVLVLTNTNLNPVTGFSGETNLWVQFSNSTGIYLTNLSLRVLPATPPVLSYASATNVLTAGAYAVITNLGYIPGLGSPASFRASNLPSGLLIQTNGTILGTPRVAGVYSSVVSASNSFGAASSNLVFQVSPVAGFAWSLSLADLFPGAVTNATYRAVNLPPGMSLNTNSGLVTGTARGVGSFDITVVQSSNGTPQQTNSTNVVIGPPAPLLRLPSVALQGRVGQPFAYQPWVSGAGWEWSGADEFSTAWTNRIIVTNGAGVTNTNRISANNNGTLLATTNGMTLTNNASNNTLALLWSAELPSSWPWQATLRMKVPGNMTRGLAGPFLGVFRAQTPLGTNFYDRYAETFLDASVAGKIPGASFMNTNAGGTTSLATVGTNEIAVRITYETNGSQLVMALNTNPNGVWTNFTSVLTNSNLGSSWNLTNAGSAFRLWAGFSASNQPTSSGQALYRKFALLPGGVAFSASNLPAWASIDPALGTIHGTPNQAGTNNVVITVSNATGRSQGTYRLIVRP